MANLHDACIDYVAREMARTVVNADPNANWESWPKETENQRTNAIIRIAFMSNLQLLELIGEVMKDGWRPES